MRWVNTGTIREQAELRTAEHQYLLAGGFNNEYEAPSLMKLMGDGLSEPRSMVNNQAGTTVKQEHAPEAVATNDASWSRLGD